MLIDANKLLHELQKKRDELAHATLQNGRPEAFAAAQGEYKALTEVFELVRELARKED